MPWPPGDVILNTTSVKFMYTSSTQLRPPDHSEFKHSLNLTRTTLHPYQFKLLRPPDHLHRRKTMTRVQQSKKVWINAQPWTKKGRRWCKKARAGRTASVLAPPSRSAGLELAGGSLCWTVGQAVFMNILTKRYFHFVVSEPFIRPVHHNRFRPL